MKKLMGIAFLVLSTLLFAMPVMAPIVVEIDVKPLSCPQAINPNARGVIPVAIVTDPRWIDASIVDPTTVLFQGASPLRWAMEDYDSDGDIDMVLHFDMQECDWSAFTTKGDYEVLLTGETMDGTPFSDYDWVKITKGYNGA